MGGKDGGTRWPLTIFGQSSKEKMKPGVLLEGQLDPLACKRRLVWRRCNPHADRVAGKGGLNGRVS
jgi:hypothetical protein